MFSSDFPIAYSFSLVRRATGLMPRADDQSRLADAYNDTLIQFTRNDLLYN